MKIALIGDGKMGRAIASIAEARGHTVTAMLGIGDNVDGQGIARDHLGEPDVAIEFTEPAAAVGNMLACARAGIPIVVGTTGWYDQLDEVTGEVLRLGASLFWAPNYSIGVAILGAAVEAAMRTARAFGGFDVHIVETHHAAKKDQPSGTAAALGTLASGALGRDVPITSIRVGHVPGTHEVIADGVFDQVRLVHEARDRRIFAEGALAAAEWLPGKRGVFTMKDMLKGLEGR